LFRAIRTRSAQGWGCQFGYKERRNWTYAELKCPGLLVIVLGNQPLLGLVLERLQVGGSEREEFVDEEVEGGKDKVGSED
jgi:hypothetical protein